MSIVLLKSNVSLILSSCLGYQIDYHSACVQVTLFSLIVPPKPGNSDAGNLDMPREAIKCCL